jgi:hypothetical protein
MVRANRVNVINAFRMTINALEQDAELHSEDPDLSALRTILLRRIAELERDDEAAANPQTPQ